MIDTETSPVVLRTDRLVLAMPPDDSAPAMLEYYESNREHLEPWEPPRPHGFYREAYWRERLLMNRNDFALDTAMRLTMLRDSDIVGQCNFTQIVRGGFQACFLGYSLGEQYVGHGYMTEALSAAIPFAFENLSLHRIMANYIPANARSARLLQRMKFVIEGYARDYLFVGGQWRDHVLTSRIRQEPPNAES